MIIREFSDNFSEVICNCHVRKITDNPEHEKAKTGDIVAAYNLVKSVISLNVISETKNKYKDAILLPVLGVEKGANQIPLIYAKLLGKLTDLKVETRVIKINKTNHTSKGALSRILTRAIFEGEIQKGKNYLLIDDIITTGGILNELRSYVEERGGNVVGVTTLGYNRHSYIIKIKEEIINNIERKFGRNEFEKIIRENGIGERIEHLTNAEGKYFTLFKNVDRIREKISEEINRRSRELYGRNDGERGLGKVAEGEGKKERKSIREKLKNINEISQNDGLKTQTKPITKNER